MQGNLRANVHPEQSKRCNLTQTNFPRSHPHAKQQCHLFCVTVFLPRVPANCPLHPHCPAPYCGLKKLCVSYGHHYEINCFQKHHLKAGVLTTALNCPYFTAKNALMETKSYCIKNKFSSKEEGIEMPSALLLVPIQLLKMNVKLTAALPPSCFLLHLIACSKVQPESLGNQRILPL